VKSKSMTTEEVDLNERLEHHGMESVETDLGEYILQLAHQRPYHIVAPALHMTRYQVADLFERELHVPRETAIEKQTALARAVLRQKFLAADIGISGANFLVADSGAVVIVENEGNARLTTSAPEDSHRCRGHRKSDSAGAGPGDLPEIAGAQRYRATAFGLHVVSQRAAARGRNRRP
jgi:L-lactate dehydrogenase complex protein LldF